ncbi:mechanosensitive ion channel [Microcoleus sp. LEGE 07076]|uniref:mechanosensitive ion channel family protein n=1 Tax=Microcoleus sp. LEGE 07076 TaxID=915322 RepID=UPI00187FD651|nr:mechanosensitive ion channel domain-containing protein [Microcoleus sp. LEGE 07076]MBE9185715.1 mechanosensitive ion channel [Microcoleus sp. LEGE 07076]
MLNPRKSSSVRYQILGIITAVALSLVLQAVPVQAARTATSVVVDGRPVFSVSDADSLTGTERADLVNLRLKQIEQSQETIQVTTEVRNQYPTILVNGKYLLTVTQSDLQENRTPAEQANFWAQQLRQALQQAQNERSAGFIKNMLVLAAATVGLAIALHKALGWLWRLARQAIIQRFVEPSNQEVGVNDSPKALNLLFNLTLFVARVALWIGTALYITNLFPVTRIWSYTLTSSLVSTFTSKALSVGRNNYSVTDLLILAALILGWVVLSGAISKFFKVRILQVTRISRGSQEAVAAIAKYLLVVVGTIVLMQIWGIDLSSLTIIFSALGVGIGFGFQDIAKNFGSGLILLFERPIRVGDFVNVGKIEGTVIRIGARSTVIRNLDQVSIILPNSRFLEDDVTNWNYENSVSRIRIPVGVAYGCDISKVKEALLKAGRGHSDVLGTPEPIVFFLGFGDSSLDFELRVWITEPIAQYRVKSDLFFRIEELFREREIEIPFPQRDLHVRSGSIPLALSPQLEATLRKTLLKSENNSTIQK